MNCDVTSVKFDSDGMTLAVGTSSGHCLLYDIRAAHPLHVKDHQYGYPIKKIQFHEKKVISADTKALKIWERTDTVGKIFAAIEPPADIHDFCMIPNTGLIHFACAQSSMPSYPPSIS